jgi:hypothetical protein
MVDDVCGRCAQGRKELEERLAKLKAENAAAKAAKAAAKAASQSLAQGAESSSESSSDSDSSDADKNKISETPPKKEGEAAAKK